MGNEERSNASDWIHTSVRFSPQLMRRINKARRDREQTFQRFVQEAVKEALKLFEAEAAKPESPKNERARGLGLRDRLQPETPTDHGQMDDDQAPTQPSIVINMPSATGGGNDIPTLARSIIEAPRYKRRALMEEIITRIARDARNEDEGRRLAAQLDEEIARLEKKQTVMDRIRARTARRGV